MKRIKLFEDFEQPKGTGKDSFWEGEKNGEVVRIKLDDVLKYLDDGQEMDPYELEHLLIKTKRDPKRVESADLKYPVILLSIGGKITSILDGQHRVMKALLNGEMVKVRILNLDNAPEDFKNVFG